MADRPSASHTHAPGWLAGVLASNPEAIDTFCREQHPAVFRLCLGFLANASDAEEAAQDAIVHLLDHITRYDRLRPFASWRNKIVLNLCRDRARKQRRKARPHDLERVGLCAAPPETGLERDELRSLLHRALATLPPREREAIVLRDLEGTATKDVAAAMGINTASVRSLVTLGRRRLRVLLADQFDAGNRPTCCEDGGGRG